MSPAIFKIWIRDNEKTDLFVLLQVIKASPSLELKPCCSVAYGAILLCLFSKQTSKVEHFSTEQLPKNDTYLMSFFSLGNDAFLQPDW